MTEELVRVHEVRKTYDKGRVVALDGVSLTLGPGQSLAVMGPSGCGKSSLLSLIGLLDVPTAGRIEVAGQLLSEVRNPYAYRARTVGFIFQDHHLIPAMTLLENVEAPMVALGLPRRERRDRAMALLEAMDLLSRADALPAMVSGGERQRAAVGRALANRPRLLLADEPTGNLDSANGQRVVELFMRHAREHGLGIVMATHNPEIAQCCDQLLRMRDGKFET
jgi:putative ABC transport system ATP-binding protein